MRLCVAVLDTGFLKTNEKRKWISFIIGNYLDVIYNYYVIVSNALVVIVELSILFVNKLAGTYNDCINKISNCM